MRKEVLQMNLIREVFHYQSRFDGATMVFKVDFPVTEGKTFPYLMKDIALLVRSGIRVVIVPGSKEWIDAVLEKYNIVTGYYENERITSEEAIPFIEMAAFHVATKFVSQLSGCRVDSCLGNFVRARGRGVIFGVDMRYTGFVEKLLAKPLLKILDAGMVPVLPCIGWSASGKPYNVSSDELALSVSRELGAVKLFIITSGKPLDQSRFAIPRGIEVDANGSNVRMTPNETQAFLMANIEARRLSQQESLTQNLRLALTAIKSGVERVHIIDGSEEGSLLRELFSNRGAGVMIYSDDYEAIRPLQTNEIPDVLRIMEPLVETGNLLKRTAEDILKKKNDYVVFEIDGSVHACGALHEWGEGQAEIAALTTDAAQPGMGDRIVRYFLDKARDRKLRRVFVLTTKTQDWFELHGFSETTVDSLPSAKRKLYDYERKSKIFALEL
ncbi:MAG: amino-acid N-acetyltransferase [Spirochaetaceae bacterium]|jgi:amino-acid N-acetyltransferase|nr:amino-acid N-acetyltransferase [Spirochaetaceae bacterium]